MIEVPRHIDQRRHLQVERRRRHHTGALQMPDGLMSSPRFWVQVLSVPFEPLPPSESS